MAAIVTTTNLPLYDFSLAQISQGACLAFYGDYQPAGAEPLNGWTALGALEEDGITETDKPTVVDVNIDQMYHQVAAFVTKRDAHAKITLSHIKPEILNIGRQYPPASLVITPATLSDFGTYEQGMGEPGIIGNGGSLLTGAGDTPTSEVTPYQFLYVFPSPGFNASTTPKAKWAAVRFWKAYATDASDLKVSKAKHTTYSFTFKAMADLSITGQNKTGMRGTFTPKLLV